MSWRKPTLSSIPTADDRRGAVTGSAARPAYRIRWIAKDNPAAARALRDTIARTAERIGTHNLVGALRPEFADPPYRFVNLTGFPYIIVYNSERRPPLIVRILHGARDLPAALGKLPSKGVV